VTGVPNVWVAMTDGVRLAASLYLPATDGPWPALLEALPYRKDDVLPNAERYRRLRDEGGYAVCRVDLRGTGSSEGVARGEYLPQEQDDLCEVVAWLAAQDWCTGDVGMFGASYSGFDAIQTAMRRPPALKAIVPMYATDDRYTDDIHFGDGVRKALEFIGYPLFMASMNALPPVPSLVPDWRERWLARIDEMVPWYGSVEEQNDSPFWRQGSLRPDYDAIEAATMIVGGWSDVYRTAAFRMIEHLRCPKRLVMGPWAHMSPASSIPGPHVDIVPEMIRWFDRWLRDDPNGIDEEPPIVLFARRSTPPAPDLAAFRGEWRFEPAWPPARCAERRHVLAEAPTRPAADTLRVRGDVGVTAHIRGSYAPPYGLPIDQRRDDAFSLVFEWPIEESWELLGNPRLEATVTASAPIAFLSAKLSEVLPDGTSALISRGLLNLTHRSSHAEPSPLTPGEPVEVAVELDATSWIPEAGNRLRLALAGADWPNAWPPPEACDLTIDPSRTSLVLPLVDGPSPVAERPPVEEPASANAAGGPDRPADDDSAVTWRIEHDVYAREARVVVNQHVVDRPDERTAIAEIEGGVVGVRPEEPGIAWLESSTDYEIAWPEVTARAHARLRLRTDAATYRWELEVDVDEDGERLASRRWSRDVPRKLQ
jgi:predicted acyl esterase